MKRHPYVVATIFSLLVYVLVLVLMGLAGELG